MKILSTISLSLCLLSTLVAQEERALPTYNRVSVATGIETTLVPGDKPMLILEVENASYEDVETTVSGDELTIKFQSGFKRLAKNKKARVTLYYQALEGIEVSSGGEIFSNSTLTSTDFDIEASSGGEINVDVDVSDLDIELSSGANITVSGSSQKVDIEVSSGGHLDASELEAKHVEADVSSAGVAKVHAVESLDAEASSAGTIKYKGNPGKLRSESNSAGSVKAL